MAAVHELAGVALLEQRGSKRAEAGVTAIEYALMASLVAMAILVALYALSDSVTSLYNNIATHVTQSTP